MKLDMKALDLGKIRIAFRLKSLMIVIYLPNVWVVFKPFRITLLNREIAREEMVRRGMAREVMAMEMSSEKD